MSRTNLRGQDVSVVIALGGVLLAWLARGRLSQRAAGVENQMIGPESTAAVAVAADLPKIRDLLLARVYHEDQLLVERTYNFVTFNAFLAGILAFISISQAISQLTFIVIAFGFLLALIQVSLGARMLYAFDLWRQYLWKVESAMGMPIDRLLFDLQELGAVDTPIGPIAFRTARRRTGTGLVSRLSPITTTLGRGAQLLFPSANVLVAIAIPWLVALFWVGIAVVLLSSLSPLWTVAVVIVTVLSLIIASRMWGKP